MELRLVICGLTCKISCTDTLKRAAIIKSDSPGLTVYLTIPGATVGPGSHSAPKAVHVSKSTIPVTSISRTLRWNAKTAA